MVPVAGAPALAEIADAPPDGPGAERDESGPGRLEVAERRARGAWSTPPWLVDHVLDVTLEPALAPCSSWRDLRILDPACGDGRFLVAAAERIARHFGLRIDDALTCVHGVELDPVTAARTRRHLGLGPNQLRTGDARTVEWARSFDVVVGNPPFLSPLSKAAANRARSPLSGGPYADLAVEFLALALGLARPDGGRIGLVLPQSVLATRDAAAVRDATVRMGRLSSLWLAGQAVFDADVLTIAASFVLGERQGCVQRWRGPSVERLAPVDADDLGRRATWSHLVAEASGVPAVNPATAGVVGDLARTTAGFRHQFYGLAPYVHEGPPVAPLVTVGLLDPGRCTWGRRPARFAGRRYQRPGVDLAALARADPALARWVKARRVPKVLVATQTRVLEAAVDRHGRWVPSVPVVSVEPILDDLWSVGAVLSSPVASAWAATIYFGAGLGPQAIKLSAGQVATIPLPAGPLGPAAAHLRLGDLDAAARATMVAYEVDDGELLAWWQEAVSAARRRTARASGHSRPRGR